MTQESDVKKIEFERARIKKKLKRFFSMPVKHRVISDTDSHIQFETNEDEFGLLS